MKALRVKDSMGQPVKGRQFGTFKGVQVGVGKPRQIRGWELIDPNGYERFSEGNWEQFVPFARLIISNYGCTTDLS